MDEKQTACRFCSHATEEHNLMVGCPGCRCMATPGEASPRTEAEWDKPVQPMPDPTDPYALTDEQLQEAFAAATARMDETSREYRAATRAWQELYRESEKRAARKDAR